MQNNRQHAINIVGLLTAFSADDHSDKNNNNNKENQSCCNSHDDDQCCLVNECSFCNYTNSKTHVNKSLSALELSSNKD